MLIVASSLQAGYSIETALLTGQVELQSMFSDSVIIEYINEMNAKIKMNIPFERAFQNMAYQIDFEDAIDLAEILQFAKRGGGDYGAKVRDAAIRIENRVSIKQEINTMTAEKRLELRVMSCMPMAIIGYIALTSEEFILPMYSQPIGRVIMTICLIMYMAFILLGEKIIEIDI